jgi:cytochrome c-type biogenesis protein CcmH/NrfG
MLDDFLDRTPLHLMLDLPPGILHEARALAYACHQGQRHAQAEALCDGLLALDHRCPWTHGLYAATLRDLGRPQEALAMVERGLRYQPANATLRALQTELTDLLACAPVASSASRELPR